MSAESILVHIVGLPALLHGPSLFSFVAVSPAAFSEHHLPLAIHLAPPSPLQLES